CVDGVIGYAPAASLASRSQAITALLPSIAARTPGYLKAETGGSAPGLCFVAAGSVRARKARIGIAGLRITLQDGSPRRLAERSRRGLLEDPLADDLVGGGSLDRAPLGVEPDDRAGRAAQDRQLRGVVLRVVDDRQA